MMVRSSQSSLSVARQKAAAASLGAAFFHDPFMTYAFPDAATREKMLARLFFGVIRCSLIYGNVAIAPGDSGALIWMPGESVPLAGWQLFRSGLLWTPLRIGLPAFNRLHAHDAFCESETVKCAGRGFAYLWIAGIRPEAAGKGLGKQMIQTALRAMESCGHSTCILRTDREQNVPLYEHLGFKQVHTGIVPASQLPYWLLSRALKNA